jgi:hypothetical protein
MKFSIMLKISPNFIKETQSYQKKSNFDKDKSRLKRKEGTDGQRQGGTR